VVTDRQLSGNRPETEVVEAALRGGATSIQLRAKELEGRELTLLARQLKAICRSFGALFFVNDRLDVALAAEADGVHLGQNDLPLKDARRISRCVAGEDFIIGVTAENVEQAVEAEQGGADYLGTAAIFPTTTKKYEQGAIGLDMLREIVRQVKIPVVAIGGIKSNNAQEVLSCGASGIAVVSAVVASPDPESAARELSELLFRHRLRLSEVR